jgi:uncharacterized protein (TIGR01732 family)
MSSLFKGGCGFNGFTLILVLFILLVIVGCDCDD